MTSNNPDNPATETSGRPPFNEVSVLFPLLSLYTAGYMALTAADFFLGPLLVLPDGIMPLYIALLGAYATDKEIRRWVGIPEPPRKGTIFVYLWLLLFLVFYVVETFKPACVMPPYMLPVCLQVLGIFFGSKTSKYLYANHAVGKMDMDSGREQVVLNLIKMHGKVTRQMIEEELKVSSATAGRLLMAMERSGLIVKKGAGKDIHYVPVQRKK